MPLMIGRGSEWLGFRLRPRYASLREKLKNYHNHLFLCSSTSHYKNIQIKCDEYQFHDHERVNFDILQNKITCMIFVLCLSKCNEYISAKITLYMQISLLVGKLPKYVDLRSLFTSYVACKDLVMQ